MNLNKLILFLFLIIVTFSGCTDLFNFSEEELKEAVIKIDCSRCITEENPQPLFVVNDKIIHQDSLKNLMPKYIRSISVLKGEEATNLYSSAGKNGVVVVKTDQKRFSSLKESN